MKFDRHVGSSATEAPVKLEKSKAESRNFDLSRDEERPKINRISTGT